MLQNRRFFALASRSGFGAAVCVAVVRNFIVLCNSVSADRGGMVVLRLLAAASACVRLFPFAAESCISYCCGCMKVANGALAVHFGASCLEASLCESFSM